MMQHAVKQLALDSCLQPAFPLPRRKWVFRGEFCTQMLSSNIPFDNDHTELKAS